MIRICSLLVLFAIVFVFAGEPCDDNGFVGDCRLTSACDGAGTTIATGTCPGKEYCCVQEKCFSNGLEGVCVNPGTCTGQSYSRYCTGKGVCCTQGARPTCSVSSINNPNNKVTITSVVGRFLDSDGENASGAQDTKIEYCGAGHTACKQIDPPSPEQVRWSTPSTISNPDQTFTGKSGLGFLPEWTGSKSIQVPINDIFPIGTLTHYNWVVGLGATPTYVHFAVSMKVDGQTIPDFKFKLGVDETSNRVTKVGECGYPSRVPCADRVDFPDSGFAAGAQGIGTLSFSLPGSNVLLTLELTGFKLNCNEDVIDEWYTQENVINQAVLYGRITRACPIASTCVDSEVVYDKGFCHCRQTRPTPVPPTPVPTTPQPTPPGATPVPPTPAPPTPMPTPVFIFTPQPPNTPQPTPPVAGTPVPPPPLTGSVDPPQIFFAPPSQSSSGPNVALIAALVGGIGACLIITGIIIAALLFTSAGKALTGASAHGNDKSNIVEGNPLFTSNQEQHFNPIAYANNGGGSGAPTY